MNVPDKVSLRSVSTIITVFLMYAGTAAVLFWLSVPFLTAGAAAFALGFVYILVLIPLLLVTAIADIFVVLLARYRGVGHSKVAYVSLAIIALSFVWIYG